MEERTLEELNNEYKSLVEKVKQIKIELEKAIAEKETADGNYEIASADFTAKKATYEGLEAGLQTIENSGFSSALVEGMKEEIKSAKEAMEEAERVLEVRREEQRAAKEGFERIETDSKKESSRLDVILVSFGANKTINQAISNEIEIDYTEMVAKKQEERTHIEALKTKINDDAKIQTQVEELGTLLKTFEDLKENVTPENAAKLAEVGDKIKNQRASIRKRIRTVGVKGGKISAEEIDRMVTEKDADGRIVVAELDRRTEVADAEIANIELEKKELLDKMKASLEIGEQVDHDDTEVAKVKSEIASLTAEKEALEKEQNERNARLAEIEKEKAALTEEENSLGAGPLDTAELNKLRADKAAIEAEVVAQIDNPKKVEIRKQIDELEEKKIAGTETDVETEEYQKAKKELENAQSQLDYEKRFPHTIWGVTKTDVIIDNPEYIRAEAELASKEKALSKLTSSIINSNPELKKLYEDYYASKDAEETINAELTESTSKMLEKKNALFTEYVSEELYPDLEDKDSQTSKDFESYKQAELKVRKAMAAVQKDPSAENIESLMLSIDDLNTATSEFQNALAESSGTLIVVSPKAIHKYLLGKLNDAYDNFEPIDEGYDLNQAERRIAALEAQTKRDENGKDNIANLRETSKGLEEVMQEIFAGNVVDDRTLIELITKHQENIAAFADPEAARSTLKGVDMEVADGRFGFFKRIISRFTTPKVEERYKFSENKAPVSKDEYEDEFYRHDELTEELEETRKQTKAISTEYGKKLKEASTEEQWKDMEKYRAEITKLKTTMNSIPGKINQTRLEKLTAEVQAAETKLKSTPQYHSKADTKAIEAQIASLTIKLNAEPDKIEDPEQAASKKRRIAETEAMIEEATIDATDPRRSEIRKLLEALTGKEVEEKTKLGEASSRLDGVMAKLKEKVSLLSMFEVARQKVMNIIRIKDANRMLDRRSGRIAEDLVNATRPVKDSQEER